jgi:hypothetical protein
VPRGGLPQSNVVTKLESGGTPKHPTGSLAFPSAVSHPGAACERRCDKRLNPTLVVIVAPAPNGRGHYQARLQEPDRVLCVSTTPYFDAARKLAGEGYDPNVTLVMRLAGSQTECLRAPLWAAADLTVENTKYGPKLRRWKPLSALAVPPQIAPNKRAATPLAAPAVKSTRRKVQTLSPRQNLNKSQIGHSGGSHP